MGDISSDPGDTVEEILKSINRKQWYLLLCE
jgi:hypothetical protein